MELTYTSGTRPLPEAHGESAGQFYSVTQLAVDLGVTARTIRFYEDKGLISPRRAGNNRVYTLRDRARMILILRGKKLGFSLREIKEYLDLYDVDPTQAKQLRLLLTAVHERLAEARRRNAYLGPTDPLHPMAG